MAVKSTLINKLESKKMSLFSGATSARESADNLEIQTAELRSSAIVKEKQATAVGEALAILNAAGVEV